MNFPEKRLGALKTHRCCLLGDCGTTTVQAGIKTELPCVWLSKEQFLPVYK